jgi:5-amino-6-(5-phosphoribosylamino)uracil reductase
VTRPELRLVLAVSLDGRLAPPQGGAAQLGGVADRQLLEQALAWADGCLIGAETLRRHGSTCLIHSPQLLARRRQRARSAQPIAVVVSRSGIWRPDLPFFSQPLERWLLLAAEPSGQAAEGFTRIERLGAWLPALERLAGAGLRRVVVLGGAALAASLLQAGLIDELQLTLCPLLLGGNHSWIGADGPLPAAAAWRLREQRLLEGGELLLRYRKVGDPQLGQSEGHRQGPP